jgi:hypothetical protein
MNFLTIYFPGRVWPIALTSGFALGVAYNDCSRSFNPNLSLFDTYKQK